MLIKRLGIAHVLLSRQFFVFVTFGGIAAAVNLALGWAIYTHRIGIVVPYWVAVVTGAAAGLCVNFTLNYKYNFRFGGRTFLAQFRTFFAVSLVGVGLTGALSSLLVNILPQHGVVFLNHAVSAEFAAHFLAVGLVTFYSYAAHRYFTFNVGLRSRTTQLICRVKKNVVR
jgi:putative flippase GtrA